MNIFCATCGTAVNENAQHVCAQAIENSSSPTQRVLNGDSIGVALRSNGAAALAYAGGLISGVAFLLIEPYRRDAYVRFHAWQSIFYSLMWIAFWIPWRFFTSSLLSGMVVSTSGFVQPSTSLPMFVFLISAVSFVLGLAGFIFWAFLLYKAYSNQRYEIPVLGRFAAAQAAHE